MIFNGTEKEYLTVTRGRNRPAFAPMERNLISVMGMSGAHLSHSKRQIRQIDVPVFIMADSFSDLQKVKEDLAEWLIHDDPKELIFKDEPDRVYYAVVDGSLDLDELVRWGQGVITFICPDPFKYGQEETLETSNDTFIVKNNGTANADPVFELTAKQKATFAMVANGTDEDSEYNLIGIPVEVDEELVDTRTLLLEERGSTLGTWTVSGTEVDGVVSGNLSTDGDGVTVASYGTNSSGWHGPALLKEITPTQDFEVRMGVQARIMDVNETYRIEFYLFDENMNALGKMSILDRAKDFAQYQAEGRYGGSTGHQYYPISSRNYQVKHDHYFGMLRMTRIGNKFEFYVTRINNRNQHVRSLKEVYIDSENQYAGRLRYVQIHIGKYADTPRAYGPKIHYIEAYRLAQATVDQTPYILYPGDKVVFDHKDEDILINGEPRNDLKNFGGSFFKLKKGYNNLLVYPDGAFDTKVTHRDKYL